MTPAEIRELAGSMRRTRVNMIGTNDEPTYWQIQDAANLLDALADLVEAGGLFIDAHHSVGSQDNCPVCRALKKVEEI